jgi:hypothetical protein
MRLLLAWASVASVVMWLPVGIASAYAWLARQDLIHAPQAIQNLATAWLVMSCSYPAISTLCVLVAWHFHRQGKDKIAGRLIVIPGIFVAMIFLLGITVFSLSRPYLQ